MRKYAVPAALLLTAVLAAGCGSAAPATTETTAAVEETKEAEETKAEDKAEAEEEAKTAVAFAGIDNPAVKAAADWLAGFAAENLKSGEGMIPVMSLAKLDDSDEKDVKLYGTYDMNSYTVDGSVLKIDETKRLTGVMHMEKDGDAYKVSTTEWAEDGSNVKSALKKIVTDENMYNEMANGTISPELKTWYIGEAVKALGLSVDSYQEKGGQPVSLSQEPKKAAEWVEKLAAGIEGDQFVNGLGGEDAGEGTTKTGLSDLKVDDLQAFGKELSTSGGIAVPKDILDMLKKGVKQDCKLVVDTEENILNGTAVQTPKGLLATAMEKVSYGEQLSEEERMAIADALEESLAGNYLGDAARYACSYTASYGIPMRDGEVDYLALSADSFPTEIKRPFASPQQTAPPWMPTPCGPTADASAS